MAHWVRALSVGLILFVPFAGVVKSQDAGTEPSPGTVGLIALAAPTLENETLLKQALLNTRAPVRAAAARVAFAQGRRGLLAPIVAALRQESDSGAAFEQARFVAAFGPSDTDRTLLEAAARMPSVAHGISLFIARARGPAAFEYMPQLRAIQGDARDLPTFIRVASRGERAPVEALVTSAARQGDVRLAAAALQAARLDDVSISDDAVEALLRESRVLRLRTTALGHLILSRHRESELSDQLRVAARAAFGTVDDPAATVIVELARRLLGDPARNDEAWMSTFTQRAADLREVLGDLWMFNLIERLSDSEYAAVTRALYGSPRGRSEPWKTDADGNARKQAGMRLLSGHPREFATSLVEATTCRPDLERNSGGGGRVSYRPDGRVARVFVADTSTSRECARVVQALLVTSVVEPDRTVRADEEDVLVFPFQRDFVTCQDALPSGPARRDVFTNPGIKPPRQRKKPSPAYPLSAKSERVSGTVVMDAIIGTTGCIGAAAVVRSVDPRLDWEARRTVAAWTFTPTVVDGAPVAVAIVVELEFRLR